MHIYTHVCSIGKCPLFRVSFIPYFLYILSPFYMYMYMCFQVVIGDKVILMPVNAQQPFHVSESCLPDHPHYNEVSSECAPVIINEIYMSDEIMLTILALMHEITLKNHLHVYVYTCSDQGYSYAWMSRLKSCMK